MPWVSGFQTTAHGIDEARLDGYIALLRDATKLGHLNAALALAPSVGVTATSANFVIGDPDVWPTDAPQTFLCCVTGGGKNDSTDLEFSIKASGVPYTVSSFRLRIHTTMMIYIHPDFDPRNTSTWANVIGQAEVRERLRARLCDWIRADVLMQTAALNIALESNEYQDPAIGQDSMGPETGDYVTIKKGRFDKSYGGQWGVLGAQVSIANYVQ